MDWQTWAQIASLMVIGMVLLSGIINATIKEWAKYKRGGPM